MEFLEREAQLARLVAAHGRAVNGGGVCALIHGEAGIGKTTLVREFIRTLPINVKPLMAGCEALYAPRPLGPLVDLADQLPPSIASALHEGRTYNGLFPSFLTFLRDMREATVLVIEDIHWADASTLDFIRYVDRRLSGVPVLVVLTYRDEALTHDHPLRRVLGELPAATTTRIPLQALSMSAVEQLATFARRSAIGIFEATAGNPFFVTEVLLEARDIVPASVRDAVLARVAHLSTHARKVAELVAITPNRIERNMLDALVDCTDVETGSLIDECTELGVLQQTGTWLAFRHEIARQAVEQSLAVEARARLHRHVFAHLRERFGDAADMSRLVHHAEHGGLHDQVLAIAPRAARAASDVSAHREAAKLYTLAIKYVSSVESTATHAELFELAAEEYRLVSNVDGFIGATQSALELRIKLGDTLHEGMNQRRLAAMMWRERGDHSGAAAAITSAISRLESVTPSIELVYAYACLSRLQCGWSEFEDSVRTGERAISLAATFADTHCLVDALHACASAKSFVVDDPATRKQLEDALDIALRAKLEDAVAALYVTLQIVGVIHRDHLYALEIANRGLEYCEARDLDAFVFRLLDNRALSLTELGRWDEADLDIDRCLAAPNVGPRSRNSLTYLKARQTARRGEAGAEIYWLQLQTDISAVPMGYRPAAIAAACAEAAWLRSDISAAQQVICFGIAEARAKKDTRLLAPLLVWAKRCGVAPSEIPPALGDAIAPQHAHELNADFEASAQAWAKLGCRYERALTLVHGDEAQMREALQEFNALGSKAAAEIARARLKAAGVRDVQRGPHVRTATDPLGLTGRQREVYELLLQQLSNAAIATKLHRSERTIENHVSDLFGKLNVKSRSELIAHASIATNPAGLKQK
jgi:DNA-binding CsgD family transcriptional regulator